MLPESMLDNFNIVKIEETYTPSTSLTFRPYKRMVNPYLDERDNRTSEQQCYSPKVSGGFYKFTFIEPTAHVHFSVDSSLRSLMDDGGQRKSLVD